MLFKGFKFGMLLQLAIGPVSLFVFDAACKKGLIPGVTGAIAATLVDALFVLLASFGSSAFFGEGDVSLGVTSFLEKKQARVLLKIFGAVILTLFGLSAIVEILGWRLFPEFKILGGNSYQNTFIKGLIITASNPLTILFWAGVFSAKIAEENYRQRDLTLFGTGAVLATLLFQSLIAFTGAFVKQFLPLIVINILNVGIGLFLIFFAIRLIKGPAAAKDNS